MARQVLPIVGAVIGGYFGGQYGAQIGMMIGPAVGGLVFDPAPLDERSSDASQASQSAASQVVHEESSE